jgi:flagellar assembly factor FliW
LVSVTIKGDTLVEANETFNVVLGTVSGTTATQLAAITSGAIATGTINNDDSNTLSISAPVITETNADQIVTFTVTSPNAVEGGFDVAISTTNGTAGAADYALVTSTVNFAGTAGETQLVSVTIKGDTIVEANETFNVTLSAISGTSTTQIAAITSGASAAGTINNDDTDLLSVSAPVITETNADQIVTFTVTSHNAVEGGFDVAISTTNGTAGAADYALVTTTVHFSGTAGETQLVSVTIKGDTIVEANETFNVVLGTVSGTTATQIAAITSGATATGTINNDDTNTLSISAPVITETNADQTVTFTVMSPNAVEGGFDVAISTTNGTAGAADYALVTTTVHFNGTVGETQSVSVTIKGDTLVEANETFNVVLGTVSGATATQIASITSGVTATGTINDDDANTLSISTPVITETNADQIVTFTVTSPKAVEGGFDVAISTTNGTAGAADYALVTTTVHFNGTVGETHPVRVTIIGDTIVEANETFNVNLGAISNTTPTQATAITTGATAAASIYNDDTETLQITAPVITETNVDQIVTFTVTSPNAVEGGFDVAISAINGTADSSDYALVTTTVHFNGIAGETQPIRVTIKGDTVSEPNDTFTVKLGAVSGTTATQIAAITSGASAVGTIINDDIDILQISAPVINETNANQTVTFTVTSPAAVAGGFDVAIKTLNGTADAADYALVTTSLHFNGTAGETHTVSVTIKGDTIVEANETFTVAFGAVSGTTPTQAAAIITTATAVGTINDNDKNLLSIAAPAITETNADQTVTFTVTSPNAVQGGFDVALSSIVGTADGSDFTLVTKTLHFNGTVGESHLVNVTIKGDTIVEVDETFKVVLGAVSGTTTTQKNTIMTGASATATIFNDDSNTLSISAPSITETTVNSRRENFPGDNPVVMFTVTSAKAVAGGFDVAILTANGTAGSNDYSLITTKVHFQGTAGETRLVSVTIIGDAIVEDNETFTVSLGAVTNTSASQKAAITTGASATGVIVNDDVNKLFISAPIITESNSDQSVSFTVTSPNAVAGGFDVAINTTNGTAGNTDYSLVTTFLHFNGTVQESKLVTVTIKGDTLVEADETFNVVLGIVSNTTAVQKAAITSGASATGIIKNDDQGQAKSTVQGKTSASRTDRRDTHDLDAQTGPSPASTSRHRSKRSKRS